MNVSALKYKQSLFQSFAHFLGAFSGAIMGFISIIALLFALTAQAQVLPNSEPFSDDNFSIFVENLTYITNLRLLDEHGLAKGNSAKNPWSGSYWPIHKGILGARYTSRSFANSKSFIKNYTSYMSRSPESFIHSGNIEELSPAEKYDLLVGDSNWTLTKFMWSKGLRGYQKYGSVAGWIGICHGWAAASHTNPISPLSHVAVRDVTGRYAIKFYANDIKGLLSFLWAEASPGSFRAGNRCRQGRVDTDPYLRPTDPKCLDSNPMTWHLAMVNRIGLHSLSMVMDSSAGPEVWNYPITGYDYSYFDPKTYVTSHSLKSAVRRADSFSDPYKKFRNPKTAYIVGIVMDTYYPALTVPNSGRTNRIVTRKKTHVYDLELDAKLEIIGGEWYGKETPDFIWSYSPESRAQTREDMRLRVRNIQWNIHQALPSEIAAGARDASQRGQVLYTIANNLLNHSADIQDHEDTNEPPNFEEIETEDTNEPETENIPVDEEVLP